MPALRAQRATARENYSPKARAAALCWDSFLRIVRPETPIPQADCESVAWQDRTWKCKSVARPDAIVAAADIVYNKEKLPARECAQVFARDRFQLFARFRGATMLETDH